MPKATTTDFPDGKFRAHGRIALEVINNNIVVYHSKGPFNAELFTALEHVEKDILADLKSNVGAWVEVIIFEESCMALDDVMVLFGEYLKELKTLNMAAIATALVIKEGIEGRLLMRDKYQQCHDDAGLTMSIFDSEKEAMNWVNTHLNNE